MTDSKVIGFRKIDSKGRIVIPRLMRERSDFALGKVVMLTSVNGLVYICNWPSASSEVV